MEPLYSVEEAARRLGGVSKWTVHSWLSKGRLKRTKVGKRTMVKESDLLQFLKDCNSNPNHGHDGERDCIASREESQ